MWQCLVLVLLLSLSVSPCGEGVPVQTGTKLSGGVSASAAASERCLVRAAPPAASSSWGGRFTLLLRTGTSFSLDVAGGRDSLLRTQNQQREDIVTQQCQDLPLSTSLPLWARCDESHMRSCSERRVQSKYRCFHWIWRNLSYQHEASMFSFTLCSQDGTGTHCSSGANNSGRKM